MVSQATCLAIFSELKSGGGQFLCCPPTLKSGGTRPPVPHRSTPVVDQDGPVHGVGDLGRFTHFNTISEETTKAKNLIVDANG